MFNPNAKLINCIKCGDIMEAGTINGRELKNCKRCRDIKNKKSKNEPLKLEQQPPEGFYRQEKFNITDNSIDITELETITDNSTENTEIENTEIDNTELKNTELDNTEIDKPKEKL